MKSGPLLSLEQVPYLSLLLHHRLCALVTLNHLPFVEHLKLSLVSGASRE